MTSFTESDKQAMSDDGHDDGPAEEQGSEVEDLIVS